jgi:hypothetical protein
MEISEWSFRVRLLRKARRNPAFLKLFQLLFLN